MAETPTPHHKIPWLALFFGLLALVTFLQVSGKLQNTGVYDVMMGGGTRQAIPPSMPMTAPSSGYNEAIMPQAVTNGAVMETSAGMPASDMMKAAYYPQYSGTANANDTREFNKMYYSASLRTRDVPALTRTVETTVRGHGGRVDQTSSSHDSGYVSFVVPQDKFDAFRDELEALVDSRFLSVNVNSENLLPQKQSIEQQQDYSNMNLDELSAARKKEISDYNAKKADLQYQIDANDRESAMLDKSLPAPDQNTRNNIINRQMELMTEQSSLRSKIKSLEQTHLSKINSIDAQVRYVNGNLEALQKQDENLMNDVATVNGTVSIRWLSLWDWAQGYLPGYSIPGIFSLLAVLAYFWKRRTGTL